MRGPCEVVLDLALTLALGGDCLADVALLRAEAGLYGLVASDPRVSRTIDALAAINRAAADQRLRRGLSVFAAVASSAAKPQLAHGARPLLEPPAELRMPHLVVLVSA